MGKCDKLFFLFLNFLRDTDRDGGDGDGGGGRDGWWECEGGTGVDGLPMQLFTHLIKQ